MSEPEEKVKSWLFLTRPVMANGMSYSAKIMGMISSSSEDPVLKTITMGLQQLATLFHSWNNQTARDAVQRLEGKDYRNLSEADKQLFEFVALNKQQILDNIDQKFEDLKDFLEPMKVKVDKILMELTDIRYTDKYEKIVSAYGDMVERKDNLQEWAYEFTSYRAEFRTFKGLFERSKVKEYLSAVHEQRCSDSIQPLIDAYKFVLEARAMFTLIQQTYYSHINEDTLKKLPKLDPLQAALDETEKGFNATKDITEAAEDVYSGLFLAVLNLPAELAEKLKLKYIPTWEDIPITPEFPWKNTNWDRLVSGKALGFMAASVRGNPCMCYRRKGENYIRVLDKKHNEESIYQLQEDGTIRNGIYRRRIVKDRIYGKPRVGDTELGSVYYDRSNSAYDDEKYCLNISSNGVIQYREGISNICPKWVMTPKYKYNKKTMTWTKIEI